MDNKSQKTSKSSLIVLIAVGIIVFIVAGYSIYQTSKSDKDNTPDPNADFTMGEPVELNDENLAGIWERTDNATTYRITFSENRKLSYERFDNGETDKPSLTSDEGSYEISDSKITISVTVSGETVTETCKAVLSKDALSLEGTSDLPGFFEGNYKRISEAAEVTNETESSSAAPTETDAPTQKPTEKEEQSGNVTYQQIAGAWTAQAPYQDYALYFELNFLSENEVRYISGFVNSEIFYEGICAYSLEGDLLHIRVPMDNETLSSTYKIIVYEDSMMMIYVDGDPLNVVQDVGSSLAYHRK